MRRSVAIVRPARLSLDKTRLLIENEDGQNIVPIEDIAVLVIDHDAIQVTGPLLGELGEQGVAVVVCNGKHLPSSILLPFTGHSLMAQTLRGQIEASKPARKRIWQIIVREKIKSQARLLSEYSGSDYGLYVQAAQVLSGDTSNREAVAAGIYFGQLFGEQFVRLRGLAGGFVPEDERARRELTINSMLNYGYAVLRAAVARAVVLSGLHPALGIHHKHRENTFSLADDLMEPLRVLVDREVLDTVKGESELPGDLNPALKRKVLKILTAEVRWDGGLWPLDAALEAYAAGVRSCLLGEAKALGVPGA